MKVREMSGEGGGGGKYGEDGEGGGGRMSSPSVLVFSPVVTGRQRAMCKNLRYHQLSDESW